MQNKIQKLLGISDDFTIKDIQVQGQKSIIICKWKKKACRCPECGARAKHIHQDHGRRKLLHEVKGDGERLYLDVPHLRLKCRGCGKVFTLRSKSVLPWARCTSHMLVLIMDRLRHFSFKQVAQWSGLSPTTLRTYNRKFLRNELDWRVFEDQKTIRLGIDEHSVAGRKKMALLVVELTSSTPVAVLYTHKKEELLRFLDRLPAWVRYRLDEVVVDLRTGYKRACRQVLPSHVKVVADPFHVIKDANRRLDNERRVAQESHFALKGTRKRIPKRALMMGKERLRGKRKKKVEKILSQYENIQVFYHFKERIRSLYRAKTYQQAERILSSIIEEMRGYERWPALRRWQRSLTRWQDEILNHFISRSSNGKVEGYNVVIKLLKRISFGMRDTELYAKKIMLGLVPMRLSPQVLT